MKNVKVLIFMVIYLFVASCAIIGKGPIERVPSRVPKSFRGSVK